MPKGNLAKIQFWVSSN